MRSPAGVSGWRGGLADLLVGDRVVVVGSVRLDPVAGPVEDPTSMARISLEAVLVGWELDG